MQKMLPQYAQQILDGGYTFGNRFLSCHDDLLVVLSESDYWPPTTTYLATKLVDGEFQLDKDGYVVFEQVKPVINEDTRFQFS